ncbi:hypothetical protein C8R42DRAFT_716745 [Lentinula raphanica]|nr:hypothetical protein C8R42DRAFT_716745 [Lentinula raphanica]
MSLQGTNPLPGYPKTLRDLTQASEILTLPSSSGSIQPGETFSSCLSVNNEATTQVDSVALKVEMQTATSKMTLAEIGGKDTSLGPLDTLENKILQVCCHESPLCQNQSATLQPPRSPSALMVPAERDKVFLKVHIQNLTPEAIWFERMHFEAAEGWIARDTNVITIAGEEQSCLYSGSTALMQPQDMRQYISHPQSQNCFPRTSYPACCRFTYDHRCAFCFPEMYVPRATVSDQNQSALAETGGDPTTKIRVGVGVGGDENHENPPSGFRMRMSRVAFCGPSTIVLPDVDSLRVPESHTTGDTPSQTGGLRPGRKHQATLDFELDYVALKRRFALVGGLRLVLVGERFVGDDVERMELKIPEARTLKEWNVIGEMLVS